MWKTRQPSNPATQQPCKTISSPDAKITKVRKQFYNNNNNKTHSNALWLQQGSNKNAYNNNKSDSRRV